MIAWPAESCRSRAIRVALLGHREPALALGLALGPQRALLELDHALVPEARALAGQPGAAPDDDAEEELRAREVIPGNPGGGDVGQQHRGGEREQHPRPRPLLVRGGCHPEERQGGTERRAHRVGGEAESDAEQAGQHEHQHRRAPAGDERQRRRRGQQHADGVHGAVRVGLAHGEQPQRRREDGHGDGRVDRALPPNLVLAAVGGLLPCQRA